MHFQILNRTNNIFELVTVEPVLKARSNDSFEDRIIMSDESDAEPDERKLRLKGRTVVTKTPPLNCTRLNRAHCCAVLLDGNCVFTSDFVDKLQAK